MDIEGDEYANHEIFMISIYIDFVEVEEIKSRRYVLEYKFSDIKMQPITEVDIDEGSLHTEIQRGICVFARLNMFNAFQQTPLYVFLNDLKHKAHCACGLDISSMLVDAYKNSGEKYTYSINLPLENKSRSTIGRTNIEISVIYMSSNLDNIECIDKIPQNDQIKEEKNSDKVEVIETKTVEKKKKKKLPRVNPRSADVYQLNLQFRRTRQNLINEMAELEEKIRRIEISKRKQKYKKQKPIIELDQTPQPESVHSRRSSFISQQLDFNDDHDSLGDELVHMLDEVPDDTFKQGSTTKAQTSYPKQDKNRIPNSLTAVGNHHSSSSEEHTEAQWNTKFGSSSQSTSSLSPGEKIDVDSSTIAHTIDQTRDTFVDTKDSTFSMTSTTQSGLGTKNTMTSSLSKPELKSKQKSESSTLKSTRSKPDVNKVSSSSFLTDSSDEPSALSKHSSKSKTKPKESSSGFSQIASSTNSRSAVKTDLSNESSSGFSSLMASQSKSKANTDLISTTESKTNKSTKSSDSGFTSLLSTTESKPMANKDKSYENIKPQQGNEKKKSSSSSGTDLSGILSMPSKSDIKSSTTKESAITGLSSVLGSTLKKDDDDSFEKLMADSTLSKKSESTTLSVLKSTNSKIGKSDDDSKLSNHSSKVSKKSQNYSSIISDFD